MGMASRRPKPWEVVVPKKASSHVVMSAASRLPGFGLEKHHTDRRILQNLDAEVEGAAHPGVRWEEAGEWADHVEEQHN